MSTDNPESSTPPRKRRTGLIVAGIVLAGILAAGGFVFASLWRVTESIPTADDFAEAMAPEPYEEIGPAVVTSIRQLTELTTVEMTEYTIIEKGTDEGWLQWARGDSLRLMTVADIGAGVDLASLSPDDFSVSQLGVVTVTVPQPEIQYVAVDEDATQVLDREKGLFTKGDPRLESEARRAATTALRDAALENGILSEAEESARTALTSLLTGAGYVDVVVNFSA